MQTKHLRFELFAELNEGSGLSVVFLSEEVPPWYCQYSWIPEPVRRLRTIVMGSFAQVREVLLAPQETDLFFIYEHHPHRSLPLYAALLIRGQPVVFIVNWIQQARTGFLRRAGLAVLQFLVRSGGFWPIHLEGDDSGMPEAWRFPRSIVLPHPLPQSLIERTPEPAHPLRIASVGKLRQDKPIEPLLQAFRGIRQQYPDAEIAFGTPRRQVTPDVARSSFPVIDTTEEADYLTALTWADIVISVNNREDYLFRPSGILADAAACGAHVVAPNYPVFRTTLTQVARVGTFYDDPGDIPAAVTEAAAALPFHADRAMRWRQARASDKLLAWLRSVLLEIAKDVSPDRRNFLRETSLLAPTPIASALRP